MREGWVEATFGEVFNIQQGKTLAINKLTGGKYPVYGANGIVGYSDQFNFDFPVTGLGCRGSCGTIYHIKEKAFLANNVMAIWEKDPSKIDSRFITLALTNVDLVTSGAISGQVQPQITKQGLEPVPIQIPPLLEQKRIVDLISSADSYIEALQQQLESAKRSRNAVLYELLTAGGDDWIETTLGEASEVIMGRQLSPSKKLGTRPRPYIRAANIGSWGINLEDIYEMDFTEIEEERFACQVGDTILVEGGNEKSVGCPALISEKESGLCIQNTVIRCRSTNPKRLDPNFQYHLLRFMFWRGDFAQLCAGTTIMHLGQKRAEVVPISIPPIGEQLDIVDTISKFDLVVSNLGKTLDNAKTLRSGLLSDLLSGEHEIPESYDKVIGAA